jgi:DNA mismatch repair protein MutL
MQVHDSYIVSSDQQGLVIVDQHALHERIIYNDLKTRIEQGGLEGQRMLLPSTITVRASEADLLTRHAEMLNRLGIEISQFGPDTVAIQQFPLMLANRGVRPEGFLRELLDRLGEDESTGPEHLLEDILEMMACKAAIKAGESMSEDEMRELLGKLGQADKSSACPHGRPTTLRLSIKDLHRQFKRL